MIEVQTGARIHIGLADTSLMSARAPGGVGFMIDYPGIRIRFQRLHSLELLGLEKLDRECQYECTSLIGAILSKYCLGASVHLLDCPPQHIGLGSKTALKLAILTGLFELLGVSKTREELQFLSGRGGASGIGIHGYFDGGIIWDLGQKAESIQRLKPSSASNPSIPPLKMLRISFPEQWRIGLCLPMGVATSGEVERRFFKTELPSEEIDSLRTMKALYHGVLPAFYTQDIKGLKNAITSVNTCGFKLKEIRRHGGSVIKLLECLWRRGYVAGMSSMGPLVYTIYEALHADAEQELRHICSLCDAQWLRSVSGTNNGVVLHNGVVK